MTSQAPYEEPHPATLMTQKPMQRIVSCLDLAPMDLKPDSRE